MIQTFVAKPDPPLSDFIGHYAIQEFDCFMDDLLKPLCGKNEIHLIFLINCKIAGFQHADGCKTPIQISQQLGPDCLYSGLLTCNPGSMVFRGHVKLLTIHFKPTGYYCLFDMPAANITDRLGKSSDLLSESVLHFHEQLQGASSNWQIFQLADSFLNNYLHKRNRPNKDEGLRKVTDFLIGHPGMYAVDKLAYAANMSLRTFERHFLEQVGVKPKLFERLKRFNLALESKMNHPDISWTRICFLTGYYDQNHFIKEFIKFAGMPPVSFFKYSAPPSEYFSSAENNRVPELS